MKIHYTQHYVKHFAGHFIASDKNQHVG